MFVRVPGNSKLLQMSWICPCHEGMVDGASKHSNYTDTLLFHLLQLHSVRLALHINNYLIHVTVLTA